jgi:hypothetical protein
MSEVIIRPTMKFIYLGYAAGSAPPAHRPLSPTINFCHGGKRLSMNGYDQGGAM